MDDSTNLRPPAFGPTWPIYPELRQLIRATVAEGPVYQGYTQQWDSTSFRDREPAYLYEPNGIAVAPGTYRTRLVGAYTGSLGTLPLYVLSLACCVATVSSSPVSSVSSISSAAPSLTPSSVTSSSSQHPDWYCLNPPWYCLNPPG